MWCIDQAAWGRPAERAALDRSEVEPIALAAAELLDRRPMTTAAFGPATVADIQTWAGRTRLGPVVQRLGDRLMELRGPGGTRYLDVPTAPRPPDDTPAPPRLIAPFDNLLLAYRDRGRLMSDAARARFFSVPNGQLPGAVLVDGRLVGEWTITASPSATVTITPYEALPPPVVRQLEGEAQRLRSPQRPDEEPVVAVPAPGG